MKQDRSILTYVVSIFSHPEIVAQFITHAK